MNYLEIFWDKDPAMLKGHVIITHRRFCMSWWTSSRQRLGEFRSKGVVYRERNNFKFGAHFSFEMQARVVVMGTKSREGRACKPTIPQQDVFETKPTYESAYEDKRAARLTLTT